MSETPILLPASANMTRLWGMTATERLRRIGTSQGLAMAGEATGPAIVSDVRFAFDPAWLRLARATPGLVLTRGGQPALAHAIDAGTAAAMQQAMAAGTPIPPGFEVRAQEQADAIVNDELRKRERPFLERLEPATVSALERASYFGAYKGVTDILTKYLWPEWALAITRLCARVGITPNQVSVVGGLLCILATVAFWYGWYWTGMAVGLGFMVLDTVDGKLARCTITSSKLGNVLDHGTDLIHPPFWWFAWGVGLAAYGRPLSAETFWLVMAAIIGGYVVQRLIEGAFISAFGMHVHVWRPFDSWFRLITARRNPNMVILFASVVARRPDWGLTAVAGWTIASLLVHLVQLGQAFLARARGRQIRSWLG